MRWKEAWRLIPELARLLREEFGSTQILVFGSAVNADYFSEESDIDLAAWGIPIAQYVGVYFPKMKNVEPNRHTMSFSLKEIVETGCQSYD